MTVEVVRHLMVNVIHSDKGIENPWEHISEIADMWIRTVYRRTCAIITFVNSYESNEQAEQHETTLPLAAEDIGLKVHYHQQSNLWYAHLALPRAGRLAEFLKIDPFCGLNELEA